NGVTTGTCGCHLEGADNAAQLAGQSRPGATHAPPARIGIEDHERLHIGPRRGWCPSLHRGPAPTTSRAESRRLARSPLMAVDRGSTTLQGFHPMEVPCVFKSIWK